MGSYSCGRVGWHGFCVGTAAADPASPDARDDVAPSARAVATRHAGMTTILT